MRRRKLTPKQSLIFSVVGTTVLFAPNAFAQDEAGSPEPSDDKLQTNLNQVQKTTALEAKDSPAVPIFEIALPLYLDSIYLGDIATRIEGEIISLPLERFIALLDDDLTDGMKLAISQAAIDDRITLGTFKLGNLDIQYDSEQQQIEVSAAAASRKTRTIDLGYQDDGRKNVTVSPENFSLFVTPRILLEYNWDDAIRGPDSQGLSDIRGTLDIGGRLFGDNGVAFLSRQSFDMGEDSGFFREETQLFYDMKSRLARVTVGDLRPRGAGFQSIPSMGGVSVERFFDLEPNRLFRPVGQSSFVLERTSTVEVRINGIVQQELFLQPGQYNVRDLPLVQGSNLVDIVIRDDTGREQVISDRNFFDFNLLAPGVMDYSVALGVKSGFTDTTIEYSGEPVVSAFVQRGITDNLTLGADLQADENGANGGVSALWASPVGVWRAEVAASQYDQFGSGQAFELGYTKTGRLGADQDWRWSVNASGQYFSEAFTTIATSVLPNNSPVNPALPGLTGTAGFITTDLQPVEYLVNGGVQISRPKWSATAAATFSQARDSGPQTASFVGGVSHNLSPRLTLGVFGNYIDNGLTEEYGATLQLNMRIGRGRDLTASYASIANQAELRYRRSAPATVGSLSYGVGGSYSGDSADFALNGDAFYTGNRFEASLQHDAISAARNSTVSQVSRATLGSSFVMAGPKFGLGRPVRDAFMILDPHQSLEGKQILTNPTETGFRARSDFLGAAIDTDVISFAETSIYVDVIDLPPGYDLGTGEYITRAPQFAGYSVEVGSAASKTLIGQVISTETGEPIAYLAGRMVLLSEPDAEPIPAFTNRNGRLAATGLKPGTYTLTLFSSPNYQTTLEVSEEGEQLLDIGTISIP